MPVEDLATDGVPPGEVGHREYLGKTPVPQPPKPKIVVHLLKDMNNERVLAKCGAEGKPPAFKKTKKDISTTVWGSDVTCKFCLRA